MNANAVKMRAPLVRNIKTREYLIYHPNSERLIFGSESYPNGRGAVTREWQKGVRWRTAATTLNERFRRTHGIEIVGTGR
jgi:hypothetical protein